MNNLSFFLALNKINAIGPRTVKKLLKRWPDLSRMFQLSKTELESEGLPAELALKISSFNHKSLEEDFAWQKQNKNNHILCWESPEYPILLKEIPDPPIILYAKGDLSALSLKSLAMVGSRAPSITGKENARYFAKELALYGVCIVSGLALGIDAEAHRGCLEGDGKTIAVLGTGIDYIYPLRHIKLAEEISTKGLILSEFPLKNPPIAGHFPRRNRIISGLSLCTLVVEAAIKSGSLITARMALEQNRDVLAIPGSIHNPLARGCHVLLQQGAKLITSVRDILDELGIQNQRSPSQKSEFILASEKENLVQFIGYETTSIDKLITRSGYSIEHLTSELSQLELKGRIVSVPGGYIRCEHER